MSLRYCRATDRLLTQSIQLKVSVIVCSISFTCLSLSVCTLLNEWQSVAIWPAVSFPSTPCAQKRQEIRGTPSPSCSFFPCLITKQFVYQTEERIDRLKINGGITLPTESSLLYYQDFSLFAERSTTTTICGDTKGIYFEQTDPTKIWCRSGSRSRVDLCVDGLHYRPESGQASERKWHLRS